MEGEPSSARRTVTSLATRAAEVREFLSPPPLSVAPLWLGRACRAPRAFWPSSFLPMGRLLSLSLSLAYPSFVSHFCLSFSFSLLAVDVVRLSVCVLPRKNSDCCCRYLRRRRRRQPPLATTTQRQRRANGNESVALAPYGGLALLAAPTLRRSLPRRRRLAPRQINTARGRWVYADR